MSDYKKALGGKEDLAFDTARNNASFSRETSTGGSQSVTKINATHIPVSNALTWGSAESVEDFLVLTKAFKDAYDVFIASVAPYQNYLGVFADSATLIATHSAPSNDDVFAFVTATNSFWHWDEVLGTPAWVDYNEQIYDRTNHTGAQAISTVTGLQTALDALADEDGDILDVDFSPTNYTPNYSGTGASANDQLAAHLNGLDSNMRKNNWYAGSPGVGDDSDDGYSIGSLWCNTNTGSIYKATDVTVGAAVWEDLANVIETLIHTEEITTSVANVEIDISSVSSNYRRLRFEFDVTCTDAASAYNHLYMELKLNGVWRTADYYSSAMQMAAGSVSGASQTTKILLSYGCYDNPKEHFAELKIDNTSGRHRQGFGQYSTSGYSSVSHFVGSTFFTYRGSDSTNVIDEVRISATNNLTGGKIRIYGVND